LLLILDHTKSILKTLLLPPTGLVLLAIIATVLLQRRPRLGRALLVFALVTLWLLSLPIIAYPLARHAQRYGALDLSQPTRAQAVVILGGGGEREYAPEYGGPAAQPYLLERLAYGAFLARKTGLPVLVTSYHREGIAMRATLERNFGIEPRWVDRDAYDTFDNARNSARLLRAAGVSRVLLVTSGLHIWRAAHEFEAAGLEVVPAPMALVSAPIGEPGFFAYMPDDQATMLSEAVIYELLGERVRTLLAATHLRRQQPPAAL
jgi:uncharacterized SAM-binding protein YcdF (DUF218 family)